MKPRSPRLAAAALIALAAPLAGQDAASVSGRVRLVGARDTVAVAGAKVVLHRVGIATQGPIDSTRTGTDGGFRFAFDRDTTASHLLSSRYADIEYFSAPLRRGSDPGRNGEVIDLLVFDTSSTATVKARSRTLVVSGPDAVGARTVVDWFTLVNDGVRTRVGSDSTAATWGAPLPPNATDIAVGDPRFTQFSPEAVVFRGDSVLVTAPLSPGVKALLLEYQLPAGVRGFGLETGSADSVEVFTEEAGARIRSPGWIAADTQGFQGRTFYRHRLASAGGGNLDLRFPGGGISPRVGLVVLVGTLSLGLFAVTALRWRTRGPAPPRASSPDTAAGLADRIARLDAEHRERPGDAGAEEAYRAERTRLLGRLRDTLAGGRRPS